jgi:metal-responsive CopG/Arc/MetJ family transcriptional regulator
MKRKLVTFDDETAHLLEKFPNQSEAIREAVRIYTSDITTEVLNGLRTSYITLIKLNREMDSKLDFISRKVQ